MMLPQVTMQPSRYEVHSRLALSSVRLKTVARLKKINKKKLENDIEH